MSKIYSQARQVLIWLEEATEYNSEALDVFSQLETILPDLPARPSDKITDTVALVTPELVMHIKACLPEGSQRQIAHLLSKPWFRRVWIIQEVVMARTAQIFIGSRSLAWSIFINVVERIVLYQLEFMFVGLVRNAQTALPNIVNLMHPGYTEARGPFFRLLCLARNFQSTDPRDKLHALLGISDSDAMSSKSVDYTIPVSNVFIQYTKRELVSSSLAHLSATNYTDDVAQVILPTWVPDWSRPVDRVPFEVVGATFNAGGTTIRRLDSSCDSKLLKIDGKKVSSIGRLGTTRINELEPLLLSTEEGGWGSQSA
ncbi:hypothetical protein NA56DRAFT_732081 [Hyaloscypha hepaticicola]|uniref:Heterokaryon incompatibility domain-containing protein n=1 Tax=Hyaloscypha hepaticicola TaxID=2082293 RepID=A0A2J6PPN3_9HELO|nr:hypothetical protein NA56DRAFT_732081 [Hyaloscypha hepaticicola]